ncbi:hypothetical protein EDD15DRAFT_2199782 [Pisolithus albus]|nr:hypothetical protein EDD15DRAFT_2199782 [Pisolithus albus]
MSPYPPSSLLHVEGNLDSFLKSKSSVGWLMLAFKHIFVNFSHWVSMDENIWLSKNCDSQLKMDKWMLHLWHCMSTVQCCHNQPLIDKMIPIYFEDHPGENNLSHVSQIFISDKAQKHSNENELDKITHNHDAIHCHLSRPWVAILVDMGLKLPKVKIKFPENASGGPCLHIYAVAIDAKTFPFLSQTQQLPLTLQNIIIQESIPLNGQHHMQIL